MESAQRIREIMAFVRAVETGSFAAAGRVLNVTSAAVSKNVGSLEHALGVRLLNRTTRSLKLTEEGKAFLVQAQAAIDALDAAMDSGSSNQGMPRGKVRISTSTWFGHEYVLPALPSLLARYPGLSVEVDFDDRVVDMVKGGYDIAIRGGHIPDSAFIARPVCPLTSILVASPKYLAEHGVPRVYQDLQHHHLIGQRFLTGSFAAWRFEADDGAVVTLDPSAKATMTLSSPASLVKAALEGVGIAQVGLLPAWDHLISGDLKIVLREQHVFDAYKMVMQYPHRALLAMRVKVALDHLADAFANNPRLHVQVERLKDFAAL